MKQNEIESLKGKNIKEIENISLEKYLKMIGFDEEEISMILDYANSEIDKKVLHEKVKYLISLGLEARQIRIILEEDPTFLTEEFEQIKNNSEILHKYLDKEELKNTLEVAPEILTMKKDDLKRNINLLDIIINNSEILKVIMQDRGEILTYKPDYLSDKFTFLINNGLKENILKILIENIEIFDLDNSEINIEELKI